MNIFQTAVMTLQHSINGEVVGQHLPVQLDDVNIPINMDGLFIPNDSLDLYSLGWISPVPIRSDYFVDEATGEKYSIFGKVTVYFDHIQCRITKYLGVTP